MERMGWHDMVTTLPGVVAWHFQRRVASRIRVADSAYMLALMA